VFWVFAHADKDRFERWGAQLWSNLGSLDAQRARELQHEIESAPEAIVDDSTRPDYYAMRALNVLHEATRVIYAEDPTMVAVGCSRAGVGLLRDFDFVLNTPAGSSASLVDLEYRAEAEWLDRLNNDWLRLVEQDVFAVELVSGVARRLEVVAADFGRAHGWDLSAW
jgi:hypothetical protein